eukprot:2052656-Rhodomonas_salina.1
MSGTDVGYCPTRSVPMWVVLTWDSVLRLRVVLTLGMVLRAQYTCLELIQRLMESGDPDLVLAACRKWSTDDPMVPATPTSTTCPVQNADVVLFCWYQVWVSALHWLASLPTLHHDAVQTVAGSPTGHLRIRWY